MEEFRQEPSEELIDQYKYPEFVPCREVKRVSWDERARVIRLERSSKKNSLQLLWFYV